MNNSNQPILNSIMNTAEYVYDHGDTSLATELFRLAININPLGRDEHIKLAHSLLRGGNYSEGLKELNWIWKSIFPNQLGIFFNNDDLSGFKVLLSADAALGDTIQFCRFSKILMSRGANVTLEVQPELIKLLHHSKIANNVIRSGTEIAATQFDIRIPLHNLLGCFNCSPTSIPTFRHYLKADSNTEIQLENKSIKRIGVCWSGHPNRPYDARRSIPFEKFAKILSIQNAEFYSLQIDNIPESFTENDFSDKIKDCNDTAFIIDKMDLIISIDSMAAHLAGALGKPVILLNRLGGCWRWLDKSSHSIWYPSMKIITQSSYNQWDDVIDQALFETINFIQTNSLS